VKYADETFKPVHKSGCVGKFNTRLNNQIAHLLEGRTSDPDKKVSGDQLTELVRIIQEKSLEFRNKLKPEYQNTVVPWIIPLVDGKKLGATNEISGTSSITTSFVRSDPPDVSS